LVAPPTRFEAVLPIELTVCSALLTTWLAALAA
jgi:hypothetical protein